MTDPLVLLRSTFGYPAFRGRQAEVIDRIINELQAGEQYTSPELAREMRLARGRDAES